MSPPAATAPPILCLAGPTASGKSALALALARHLPIEIISVDSAQVYRGMDIGTAKPSPAEQSAVAHHLIDIRDPEHSYSAADFVRDTQALIPAIRARGRLPVLVGGTMLYYKALFDGLDALPPADATVRQQLEQRAQAEGWPALHTELARIDPTSAARLAPGDSQRIQRALEVWHITGQPLSSFHTQAQRRTPTARAAAAAWLLYTLEPQDRAWLHQRINQRFAAMLDAGLIDELRQLRQRHPGLHPALPAMRCVGYRQAWQALDEHWPTPTLQERGSAATRQLAKRQLTWLRGMPQRHTIPAETLAQGVPEQLLAELCQQLQIQT